MDPTRSSSDEPRTHFGFQDVPESEKAGRVRAVFESVAPRYDLMNDLMSAGVHRLWKNAFADWASPRGAARVLDMAGGTGDIAFRLQDRAPDAEILIADINPAMLQQGVSRAVDQARLRGLTWACMDAEKLALPDRSVDLYTIAFGIRNVTHVDQALREAYRVLRPGGRFLCLEFSTVAQPALARLYDLYSFEVLPRLGQWVAKDAESYRYLAESIRRFPPQAEFAAMIRAAGFGQVSWRNLSGGIAAMHTGWRI